MSWFESWLDTFAVPAAASAVALSEAHAAPEVGSDAISPGVRSTAPDRPCGVGPVMPCAVPFAAASASVTHDGVAPADDGRSGLTGRRVDTRVRARVSTRRTRRGRPTSASLLLRRSRRRLGLVRTKPTRPFRRTARVTLNSYRTLRRPGTHLATIAPWRGAVAARTRRSRQPRRPIARRTSRRARTGRLV